jgi:predicted CopG family antitoxin
MVKQITLDDDVYLKLVDKAIELNMVLCSASDVLRVILNTTEQDKNVNSENFPTSEVPEVQRLLDGLREIIFTISKNGMQYHSKNRRWVADPNTVTITVQDSRARNLRITVYGRPHEFYESLSGINMSLDIKPDMAGYSRFVLINQNQLPYAVKVVQHSYNLKKARGRL